MTAQQEVRLVQRHHRFSNTFLNCSQLHLKVDLTIGGSRRWKNVSKIMSVVELYCLMSLSVWFHCIGCVVFCVFVVLRKPERLRDEEIEDLEQQLQSQALGPSPQSTFITQEEPPVPSNCFKFQNKVFGESWWVFSRVCPSQTPL